MAPEVLRGDDFDDKSDVYAFGVILWELVTRTVPWEGKSLAQLVGLVGFSGARLELPAKMPEGCPASWPAMIKGCFAAAAERPTFRQLREQLDQVLADLD